MIQEVSKRLINVEEYYKMSEVGILGPKDHVELIHGEIIEMSPIGSRHASAVNQLAKLIIKLFDEEVIVSIQAPVHVDAENEPEPDISILNYREDHYSGSHPKPEDILILIEVADSSYAYDVEVKAPLYASANVPEFWMINLEKKQLEVYQSPRDNDYMKKEIFKPADTVSILGKAIVLTNVFS